MMRNLLVLLLLVCFLTCFLTTILSAQEDTKSPEANTKAPEANTKASGRVEAAGTVLDEIQGAPDQRIPEEVLGSAECVAVVPSLLKGGMDNLLSSQFKLGADASAAAGPVGRHASADTDWKMRAQVLTYSRARGLFAGLELHGAVIKQDKDSTREFYGRMVPFKTSLTGEIETPKAAYPFLSTLAKWAQQASKERSGGDGAWPRPSRVKPGTTQD